MKFKDLEKEGYSLYYLPGDVPFFARKYENRITSNIIYSQGKASGELYVDFRIETDEDLKLVEDAYNDVKRLAKELNEVEVC